MNLIHPNGRDLVRADGSVVVEPCQHPNVEQPVFDEVEAQGLDEYEVRKRWPRVQTYCFDCHSNVILYASAMHCIMGDW